MSNVAIFNEGNNRVLQYLKSVNTPDYSERTDVVVNPDVSALVSVAIKYWKHSAGSILEMTQAEKDAVDAEELAEANATQATAINNLDISIKDAFIAWLQVYNSKVPAQYQVTNQELKDQVLTNAGL